MQWVHRAPDFGTLDQYQTNYPIEAISSMSLKLVIGNHNYSSWSLRGWFYLRASGIPFETIRLPLFTPEWKARVYQYSPAGRVPVLLDDDLAVWDTTAIFAYLQEEYPHAIGWPAEKRARAEARSIAAEMHSGFMAVRDELPQNIRARTQLSPASMSDACRSQMARIFDIWASCRSRFGDRGPWLFGELSIADVMYAPVALRFITYEVPLPGRAAEFVDAVTNHPAIQEWQALAAAEEETLDFIDNLNPIEETPLTQG